MRKLSKAFRGSVGDWIHRIVVTVQKPSKPIGLMLGAAILGSLVAFSTATFFFYFEYKASSDPNARLQAWASILGSGLGIFGAVTAVLFANHLENRRSSKSQSMLLERLRRELVYNAGVSILVYNICREPMRTYAHPGEQEAWAKNDKSVIIQFLNSISFEDFKYFASQIHEIDPLIPAQLRHTVGLAENLRSISNLLHMSLTPEFKPNASQMAVLAHYKSELIFNITVFGGALLELARLARIELDQGQKEILASHRIA